MWNPFTRRFVRTLRILSDHILKIPFVDKPVDLPGFFVALIRGVGIVNNADKADAPNREQAVNVLLYKLQFAW